MNKFVRRLIVAIIWISACWLSFSHWATLDLTDLAVTDLHFWWNGNNFGAKLFLKDLKSVSETVMLNWSIKNCTKQIRGYYFNPVRWLRIWPLDQDSLAYLRTTDSSYNNLSLSWWLFLCDNSSQAIYGSIVHRWKFNTYYIVAWVNYNFTYNTYFPSYLNSMLFVNGLSVWYMFDSYWGIASIFGTWLLVSAICWNGIVEGTEMCDQWINNGKVWFCNITCNGITTNNGAWWAWWGWGWWWEEEPEDNEPVEIPLASGLQIISGIILESWNVVVPSLSTGGFYNEEMTSAYLFAYKAGITTRWPITAASLKNSLMRNHAAKMISQFAMRVLEKTPDDKVVCKFTDMQEESLEMQYYAELSCKLGLMWLQSDGTPNTVFNPNAIVTRAQFGTMLSRLLYGDTYNAPAKGSDYYTPHLKALQKADIMKNISMPWNTELRWYVLIMMRRISSQKEE